MLKAVARVAVELGPAVERVQEQVQAAAVLEALAQEARDLEPAVAGTLHR
jgi:hypothetical protein